MSKDSFRIFIDTAIECLEIDANHPRVLKQRVNYGSYRRRVLERDFYKKRVEYAVWVLGKIQKQCLKEGDGRG